MNVRPDKRRKIDDARVSFENFVEDRRSEIIWELSRKLQLKEETVELIWNGEV